MVNRRKLHFSAHRNPGVDIRKCHAAFRKFQLKKQPSKHCNDPMEYYNEERKNMSIKRRQ